MARHTQQAQRTAILRSLRAGNTRTAASACAGISRECFYNWLRSDVTFSDAVEKAEAEAEVSHVANVVKAAAEGNWTASAWWLERRRYEDWGRKDRVELVNTVRELAKANGLTDEETESAVAEAERYVKEMRGAGRR